MKFEKGDLLTIRTDELFNPAVTMYEERPRGSLRCDIPKKILSLGAGDVVIFLEEPRMHGLRVVEPKSGMTGIVSAKYFKKVE